MQLTKEQEDQAKKRFEENIKNVDNDDIEYAVKKGLQKIQEFKDNPPAAIIQLWNDIKLMISLLNDYIKGNYKDVPWKTISAITAALLYFLSPIDLIPDFIPVIGYLDDILVLRLALTFSESDLEKYKVWKNQ